MLSNEGTNLMSVQFYAQRQYIPRVHPIEKVILLVDTKAYTSPH